MDEGPEQVGRSIMKWSRDEGIIVQKVDDTSIVDESKSSLDDLILQ